MIEYDIQSDFCNLLYKNLEMQTIHPPYEQELRELHCIENGDLELLEKTIPQSYDDSYNAILAKNPIRHIKNLGIVVVTLACRAAIRGGIDPEIYSGYAFGMGIDRVTMVKYGIPNIRLLFENDVRFLKQF